MSSEHEHTEKLIGDLSIEEYDEPEDFGIMHSAGTPLIEVHRVSVHHLTSDSPNTEDPLDIYGVVRVTNGRGMTYEVYDQSKNAPNSMYFGEELPLWYWRPISSPFPVTNIFFHIMDKKNNLELARGTLTLDYEQNKILFETKQEKCILGENGFITVSFTIFEVAVCARISVRLYNQNDTTGDDGKVVDVLGDISASYCHNYSFNFADSFPRVELLCTDDSIQQVKHNTDIRLYYDSVIAVPVYASLDIQVALRDLVDGKEIFRAYHVGVPQVQFYGSNGYYVDVALQWISKMPLKETIERSIDDGSPRVFFIYREAIKLDLFGEVSMEVYSFLVLPDEKLNQVDVLNLYGKVFVEHDSGVFHLFQRSKNRPEPFPRGKWKKIVWEGPHEHCFIGLPACMRVELEDDRGIVFCKGFFGWCEQELDDHLSIPWYERRICSIIKGDYGLVKVHYSIFDSAVRASVMVSLSFDHDFCDVADVDVSGTIFATYGWYDYTPYDREYNRSLLFLKRREFPFKVSERGEISLPMMKSVVAVPDDTFMIIEVDLCTTFNEDRDKVVLQGVANFEVGRKSCSRLENKYCYVDLFVDW